MRERRVILAIDPGVASMGYAVLSVCARKYGVMDYGVAKTEAGQPFPERLLKLFRACRGLARRYKPTEFAVERLFFSKNTKTAMLVAQAQGVAILAAAFARIEVTQYTPMEVKISVTGHGNAEKSRVAQMTQKLLGLSTIPKPDDAADALALAYCHAVATRRGSR